MKKQKQQSLLLHKQAISKLDRFVIGGRANGSDVCTQNPQTPSQQLTACRNNCPGTSQTAEPTNKGC
ncbi:hypothetical protein [Kordia sp. SMS9]|uniref:hypothetical protein n=1 Tax=Kordia sp. SMS9 TaxID=2282170 RepID=UPI000E0DDBFD|nr:hypothetical protein [Kordia sp. SMS9]